jgi:hypothetical protein
MTPSTTGTSTTVFNAASRRGAMRVETTRVTQARACDDAFVARVARCDAPNVRMELLVSAIVGYGVVLQWATDYGLQMTTDDYALTAPWVYLVVAVDTR